MKTTILASMMILLSSSAFAKIAIYNNQAAVKAVLEDTETMSKIKKSSDAELTSVLVSNSGESIKKKFTVRLTYTGATPIGSQSCYTDVNLVTMPKVVKLDSGAQIATSILKITKVSQSICEKQ